MIRLADRSECCGCSACASICPQGAIRMVADGMGFKYPETDASLCTDCGLCNSICAFRPSDTPASDKAEAIRFPGLLDSSQSGGLGYALMHKAILSGYVVYGAAMDGDFTVRHRRVTEEKGLEPLRLSKYVQSDTTGIPSMVLEDLKAGRKVLFTGTPCQCAGIASIAGSHRGNLLLSDIICHGVPSPSVWKDFIRNQEKIHGKQVTGAFFRDKSLGWHDHRETLCFESEKQVSYEYTFLFYQHLMLRPSCTECPFASLSRPSDITMADCWGVEKDLPGFADDNSGCSLLIVHTKAGEDFTGDFPDECVRKQTPMPVEKQPNLYRPSKAHKSAAAFERVYLKKGYAAAWKRFGTDSRAYRFEEFIKKVKRHI